MAIKIKAITASVVALLVLFEFTIFTATDYLNHQRPASFASSAIVTQRPTEAEATAKQQIAETYGKLPLTFEANQGQTDSSVQFISRGSGYNLYLTPTEAVLMLRKENTKAKTGANQVTGYGLASALDLNGCPGKAPVFTEMTTMRMKLVDGNENAEVSGLEPQPASVNYFIGNDPQRWQTGVPIYGRVQYKNVYRGVDLAYYGKQRQLEYDFIVNPGADPKQIRLGFEGAKKIRIDESGDLVLTTKGGDVRQHKPVIYQEMDGGRQEIAGSYVVKANQEVGFEIGYYDIRQQLVIDPVLSYSTYLGGNNDDSSNSIAVDSSGNIYVTGFTQSTNFPTLNSYQADSGDLTDAFVTKLTASGSLSYSTYFGGNLNLGNFSGDVGQGIAVDSTGNAYVTGYTWSPNFPTLNALQSSNHGQADAFVTKLTTCGRLSYSTYLGGNNIDSGSGIAVDSAGKTYVTGDTRSADFPTLNAFQSSINSDNDAFVTILSDSSPVVFSEFRTNGPGGASDEFVELYNNTDCAMDVSGWKIKGSNNAADISTLLIIANGTIIPAGGHFLATNSGTNGYSGTVPGNQTYSTNIPDDGGVALTRPDDFIIDQVGLSTGSAFKEGTVLAPLTNNNGSYERKPGGLNGSTLDANNNASDFQVITPSDPQNLNSNPTPGLISTATPALVYSTFLGGNALDTGFGIAVDSAGNIYVTGRTDSTANFPILNAFQPHIGGRFSINAFVTKLTANGAVSYSTYLGGQFCIAYDIAVDSAGNAYVTGATFSDDFPTLNAYQSSHASPNGATPDAFVSKLAASGALSYSTYLGGIRDDQGLGIAVDPGGNAYVTGHTRSTNFPTLNAFQPVFRADLFGSDGNDAFVTKLTPSGGLSYSTYLGGSRDDLGQGIALDAAGRAYVTGQTSSPDFPTANPMQAFLQGGFDSFVAKIFDSSLFSIEAIAANKGGNNGNVSVSVLGAGFQPGATVKLKAAGQPDIEGTNSIVVSTSRISTTFNLRGATPGLRDLVVTLQDGSTAMLRDGFTIEEGGSPHLWVDILGRNQVRVGQQATFQILVGNSGDVDMDGFAVLQLSVPDGVSQVTAKYDGLDVGAFTPGVALSASSAGGLNAVVPQTASPMVLIPWTVGAIPAKGMVTITASMTLSQSGTLGAQAVMVPGDRTGEIVYTLLNAKAKEMGVGFPEADELFESAIKRAIAETIQEGIKNLRDTDKATLAFNAKDLIIQNATKAADEAQGLFPGPAEALKAALIAMNTSQFSFLLYSNYKELVPPAPVNLPEEKLIQIVTSRDPNDKVGSLGVSNPRYLSGKEPLRYAIYFENVETATAPAQEVVITDQLDTAKLDLNTFGLGPIAFGNKVVTPPSGLSEFNQDVDLRPSNNLIVRINARLDKNTGLLSWRFASIDPDTGFPTEDPLAGFLPPNVNAPEGDGSVLFTVMPKQNLVTGTEVRNQAQIIFDANAPVSTPQWFNTLDNSTPTSNVHAITASPCSVNLNVQWTGTDTGSGIRGYTIYVSDNGGPFAIWQSHTTATSGTYSGQSGHTYAFYSVSQDQTGNTENAPTSPDATVTLIAPAQPTIVLTGQIITLWPPNHKYETIRLTQLVASASDSCGGNLTGNVVIAQASSDEPDDAQGDDGNTLNDIVIAPDCKSVLLRSERNGSGNGRVYTLTLKVRNAAGNTATATTRVRVPKSQNGNPAVDDGPAYTVTRNCP